MHGLVRCKHECRCSRVRGADVSFRDVTIKIPDRGCDRRCEWRHTPEVWAEIWEKSVSWVLVSEEDGWLSGLAEIRPVVCTGVWWWWGGRWKSQHRKIVLLSPYVEKPFNSRVIKSFAPELRSHKCFLCFGIPVLSIYELWTFYENFTYSCMVMLHYYHSWHHTPPTLLIPKTKCIK